MTGPDTAGAAGSVDVLLVPAGDGGRDVRVSGGGDLAVCSGTDTAVQALTLRLLVRRGELAGLGLPEYGSRLHELVGARDAGATRVRLAAYAREAVAPDPRVREVTEVEVTTDRSEARVRVTAALVGTDDPVHVVVLLPLATP